MLENGCITFLFRPNVPSNTSPHMKTMTWCLNWAVTLLLLGVAGEAADVPAGGSNPGVQPPHLARLEWWRAARFGMFIHWGPVSLKGTEIGWSRGAQIPIEEYDRLHKSFDPVEFNAGEWMRVAAEAGMKYVVFTTKHHDGFCMWDTKQTDFNIMQSPFGRDVVKELAQACRQRGLAFGTYHSVCDWHHPDFPLGSPGGQTRKPNPNLDRYETYLRSQMTELIRNYGPLLIMWFDVPQEFDRRRGQGLIDLARSLQPDIIVNNRSGAPGDYDTPEQRVGAFQIDRPWETCMTICQQWAWKPNDTMKPLKECLQTLVLCAGGDGNLLFNVGPMPDGRIEPRQVERLREMGAWLARHGQTIYGTRGGPWKPSKALASTRRGREVFVHVLRWDSDTLTLPNLPMKIIDSTLLTGGRVRVTQTSEGVSFAVAPEDRSDIDTIVRLELEGSAMDIAPLSLPSAIQASASTVYQNMMEYGPESAFDDDDHTRWATDAGTKTAWVARDFGRPRTFHRVRICEAYPGRVERFELQYKAGSDWKTIFAGTQLGENFTRSFEPVSAREVRLNILDANEGPTIWEIRLD